MAKLWQTKSTKLHPLAEKYTVGNDYILDQKILPFDLDASAAHAQALKKLGILSQDELKKLLSGLEEIRALHAKGKFPITQEDEDCHTAIENYLVKKFIPADRATTKYS